MSSNDTAERRTPKEQEALEGAIRELCEHKIVFNEYLGFRIRDLSGKTAQIEFNMRPELIGHYMHGRLHGGVISTVLDAAGGLAVIWAIANYHKSEPVDRIMERFKALATIDLRVDYLRPGIGGTFYAESEVVRLGRRIATTRSILTADTEKEIATASAAYIVS